MYCTTKFIFIIIYKKKLQFNSMQEKKKNEFMHFQVSASQEPHLLYKQHTLGNACIIRVTNGGNNHQCFFKKGEEEAWAI